MIRRVLGDALRAITAPGIFLGLVAYCLWSATQGDRGLQASAIRQAQLKALNAELVRVQGEQTAWERRVAQLSPQHLDPDMLDERARAMSNMVDPGDIVVQYAQGKRLFTQP
jgi:cell division protein FtsB